MKFSCIGFWFSFIMISTNCLSQDTFSIVAVDSLTGQVGSAGASCVDLDQFNLTDDTFLGVLIPGVGAINTQAYYRPGNQNNATDRMLAGDTPSQIIDWLLTNDIENNISIRQYGVAALVDGSPSAAAHTGVGTDDYKGHILGPNYAIQGNILLGPEILDSMEARFLREEGDLSCKLMAAMQGANVVGADTRCSSNGTSSLFAFVKVANINDVMGSPSFVASVRTNDNDQIEPIDSLQTLVNELIMCNLSDIEETIDFKEYFTVFPNPATSSLNIKVLRTGNYNLEFVNQSGKTILTDKISTDDSIDVSRMEAGIYFLKLSSESVTVTQEVLIK